MHFSSSLTCVEWKYSLQLNFKWWPKRRHFQKCKHVATPQGEATYTWENITEIRKIINWMRWPIRIQLECLDTITWKYLLQSINICLCWWLIHSHLTSETHTSHPCRLSAPNYRNRNLLSHQWVWLQCAGWRCIFGGLLLLTGWTYAGGR